MKIAFVFVCSNALSNHVVISPPTFGCDWLWFWLSLGEVCPLSAHRPIIIDRGHSYHRTESIVTMKQRATKRFIFVPWTQLCPEGLWVFPMVGRWRVVCGQLWLSAFRGWSFRRVRIGMGLRPICYAQKCKAKCLNWWLFSEKGKFVYCRLACNAHFNFPIWNELYWIY